jgi:thiol:disulfide interchange protein
MGNGTPLPVAFSFEDHGQASTLAHATHTSRTAYYWVMNSAYRPLIVVGVMVAGMVGFATWRKATEPVETIPWRKTLAEAKREAAANHKPVLAYFTASWCGPCQRLKRETWPDAKVQAALTDRFVPVKIDVDEHADLAQEFGVTSIPRMQVIQPDGTLGPSRAGFISPDELTRWLQGA